MADILIDRDDSDNEPILVTNLGHRSSSSSSSSSSSDEGEKREKTELKTIDWGNNQPNKTPVAFLEKLMVPDLDSNKNTEKQPLKDDLPENATCARCHVVNLPHTTEDLPAQYCKCFMHRACAENLIESGIDVCQTCFQKIDIIQNQVSFYTIKVGVKKHLTMWCLNTAFPTALSGNMILVVLVVCSLLIGYAARALYYLMTDNNSITIVVGSYTKVLTILDVHAVDLGIGFLILILSTALITLFNVVRQKCFSCCQEPLNPLSATQIYGNDITFKKPRPPPDGLVRINDMDQEPETVGNDVEYNINKPLVKVKRILNAITNYVKGDNN